MESCPDKGVHQYRRWIKLEINLSMLSRHSLLDKNLNLWTFLILLCSLFGIIKDTLPIDTINKNITDTPWLLH